MSRKAFTLIELLAVIAIIAILAAILFPVFAQAREKARQTMCLSNTKQIGTAVHMYTQDYDETLPEYWYGSTVGYWHIVLIPYVKNSKVYICPSARNITAKTAAYCDPTKVADPYPSSVWTGSGSYGYNYFYLGPDAGTGSGDAATLASIDQPADTLILTESTKAHGYAFTFPGSLWNTTYNTYCMNGTFGDQIPTWHNDGSNIVWCDGHAKWMKKSALGDYNHDGKLDDGYFCLQKNIGTASCPQAN